MMSENKPAQSLDPGVGAVQEQQIPQEEVVSRLLSASIRLSEGELEAYMASDDVLDTPIAKGAPVPLGYKRCGKCEMAKKLFLFNKNAASKTNTSGSCKECQRSAATASYARTKKTRSAKKYYAENRDRKREQAREYYQRNKEHLNAKRKIYGATAKGKKVMQKSHTKRREALLANVGFSYTRAQIIRRDLILGQGVVECYLCGNAIEDRTGVGLHLDHMIPVAIEGKDCFTNVASVHAQCNLNRPKDGRDIEGETLKRIELIAKASKKYVELHPEEF